MKDELLLVQNFKKTIFYIEKIIDNLNVLDAIRYRLST